MAKGKELSPFDDRDVLATAVIIRNTGDGLSKEMKIDPREFHHGERVTIALDCVVDKVRFDEIPDTEGLMRVHVFKAGTGTVIPSSIVKKYLDESERKIERAKGIERLPDTGTVKVGGRGAGTVTPPAKKAAPRKRAAKKLAAVPDSE